MTQYKNIKPARNPDELLNKLTERGLIMREDDDLIIKKAIRTIGYFRLSGYFGPLQDSKDRFRANTSIDDILRLYDFDRKLRIMTSQALKFIEIELKARLTDIMASSHESDWYCKEELFMTDKSKPIQMRQYSCDKGVLVANDVKFNRGLYDSLTKEIINSIKRNEDMEYLKNF
jgi:abortive infection bacteriophage resistance protein